MGEPQDILSQKSLQILPENETSCFTLTRARQTNKQNPTQFEKPQPYQCVHIIVRVLRLSFASDLLITPATAGLPRLTLPNRHQQTLSRCFWSGTHTSECKAVLISNLKSFLPVCQCNSEQSGDNRIPMGRLSQEMRLLQVRMALKPTVSPFQADVLMIATSRSGLLLQVQHSRIITPRLSKIIRIWI